MKDKMFDKSNVILKLFCIVGGIAGTIIAFNLFNFSDVYKDSPSPTGLITLVLAIILWLLPIAVSALLGGGLGAIVGAVAFALITGLIWAIKQFLLFIKNEFILSIKSIRSRHISRKQTKKLGKENDISKVIADFENLQSKNINEVSVQICERFCDLLDSIHSTDELKSCISVLNEKRNTLNQIRDDEKIIVELAEQYSKIGNIEKCNTILDKVKSSKKAETIKSNTITIQSERTRENKAIKRCVLMIFLFFLSVTIVLFSVYLATANFREIKGKIEAKTLTREMCDYGGTYYDYFKSSDGNKLIAQTLSDYHSNDDFDGALWFLCIQPNKINGMGVSASNGFIYWIYDNTLDIGTKNDKNTYLVKVENQEYTIDFDLSGNDYAYNSFSISNGQNHCNVEMTNQFYKEQNYLIS